MQDTKALSVTDIDAYLARVKASAVLGRSKRRIKLLSYLITSEFSGDGEQLKAYSIGLDVFGKCDTFDPTSDSIVRVEMGRLRTAIALFEASDCADTRMVVDIPVGTYQPVLSLRQGTEDDAKPPEAAEPRPRRAAFTKTLVGCGAVGAALLLACAIVCLEHLAPSSDPETLSVQISLENPNNDTARRARAVLSQSLSRSKVLQVFAPAVSDEGQAAARFEVNLSVSQSQDGYRATFELQDVSDQRLLWSKTLVEATSGRLIASVQAHFAQELRVRLWAESRALLETLDLKDLSPEELFVMATWVPGAVRSDVAWENSRIELARLALKLDPAFGAAHSVLADKLAYLANAHAPADTIKNRRAAAFHGRRAMDLAPFDSDVVFNVAQSHWHAGRITESRALLGRVLELNEGHDVARFLHLVVPYTCTAAPDIVMQDALAFDAALSRDNPLRWVTLTWIGWLHGLRQEWAEALPYAQAASRIFQNPYSFMNRALTLHHLGQPEAAAKVIAAQSENWAGFDPAHFANITMPRLCHETGLRESVAGGYDDMVGSILSH